MKGGWLTPSSWLLFLWNSGIIGSVVEAGADQFADDARRITEEDELHKDAVGLLFDQLFHCIYFPAMISNDNRGRIQVILLFKVFPKGISYTLCCYFLRMRGCSKRFQISDGARYVSVNSWGFLAYVFCPNVPTLNQNK